MKIDELIGKDFIRFSVIDIKPTLTLLSKEFTVYHIKGLCNKGKWVNIIWNNGSIETNTYSVEEVEILISEGDWLLVATDEQVEWLKSVKTNNFYSLADDELQTINNVLNRLVKYYTPDEREILNNLRKLYKQIVTYI